ncbi:DUF308 domain-containing protein [Bacillus sp. JCM 19041]|uniref:DUF308 domain-containing protein n=1 Tax=Bacillus sp. JCM 19041 TaxID=1460637 RepID=UPI0009EB4988
MGVLYEVAQLKRASRFRELFDTNNMKNFFRLILFIISVLLIFLGVIIWIVSSASLNYFMFIIGVLMVIFGVFQAIYTLIEFQRELRPYKIIFADAIVLILIGSVIVFNYFIRLELLVYILGVWLLLTG